MLAIWLSFEVFLIQKMTVFWCCLSLFKNGSGVTGSSFLVKILAGTNVNRKVYQCKKATLLCKYFIWLFVTVLALESCARVV